MKESFYNIQINVTHQQEVFSTCKEIFQSTYNRTHSLFFLNAHCFNVAQNNPEYFTSLANTDFLLNDGVGLKIASYFSKIRFRENLNGTDLIPKILQIAAQEGEKVFFLGGKEGIASKAAHKAQKRIPNLKISGSHSGYFSPQQEPALIERINKGQTGLLVIGMGVPMQELWVAKNRERLTRVKLIIAGGAILDFLSGEIERAPVWMQKSGLEWVYRLLLEPGRMWRRYLIGNFVFFYHIFRLKFN